MKNFLAGIIIGLASSMMLNLIINYPISNKKESTIHMKTSYDENFIHNIIYKIQWKRAYDILDQMEIELSK